MKKNIIIAVLATIVVGFISLLIVGLVLEENYSYEPSVPPSLVQEEFVPSTKDQEAKRLYMSGCDENGDQTQYCLCTWEGLGANFTISQIMEMGLEYEATGTMPDKAIDIMADCLKYIN